MKIEYFMWSEANKSKQKIVDQQLKHRVFICTQDKWVAISLFQKQTKSPKKKFLNNFKAHTFIITNMCRLHSCLYFGDLKCKFFALIKKKIYKFKVSLEKFKLYIYTWLPRRSAFVVECKLEDNKRAEAQTQMPRIRHVVWHFPLLPGKCEIKDCQPHRVPPFAITLFSPFRALMSEKSRSRANTRAATSSSMQFLKRTD